MPGRFDTAIRYVLDHETPWPRDPRSPPAPGQQRFGVHHDDPPPWNRLLGPLHPRGGPAGVVWVGGREVAAWGEPDRADQTFSVAKTYLALLAGIALERGLIRDLHEPVVQRLPGIGFDDGANRAVSWHQLLQQTSEWQGACFGLPDQVDHYRKVASDPRPAAGRKGDARPLQPPGSHWEYNDVRINQLSLALLHLFRRPLQEVFGDAVLAPLGPSSDWCWQPYDEAWVTIDGVRLPSVPGGTHWGGGVSIGARDQARIADWLLRGGRGVLPDGWLERMRTPCPIAPFYGYLVWLNPGRSVWRAASEQAFCMAGAGGHLVWIEPAAQAVVVARWLDPAATNGFMALAHEALAA